MRHTTPEPHQVNTIFGSGYVPEQHADETDRKLPPTDHRAIGIATLWLLLFILAIVNVITAKFGKVVEIAMACLTQP
jgi:hypothetical protein